MRVLIDRSMFRFILVGMFNTLLSFITMFLLEGLGYWPSTAIAYAVGSVLSFFLNRSFTFHSEEALGRSAVKFAVNVAVCYVIAYTLAQPAADWVLGQAELPDIWRERLLYLSLGF